MYTHHALACYNLLEFYLRASAQSRLRQKQCARNFILSLAHSKCVK